MTCTMYCVKIEAIFAAMTYLARRVPPENQRAVEYYIHTTWRFVTALVQSIEREEGTDYLKSKFESHVVAEEKRLRRNLEDIKFRIDGPGPFWAVSGEGRVERVIKPVFVTTLVQSSQKFTFRPSSRCFISP